MSIWAEGIKSRGNGDLVGQEGNAEITEEHAERNESAQATESTWGSGHDDGTLPRKGGNRGLVRAIASGDPVDGILQRGGVGAIIFRGGDDQPLVREEEGLEPLGFLWLPTRRLEILVKERHREIAQLDQCDLGARIAGSLGGDGCEFLIKGVLTETTAEGKDTWSAHAVRSIHHHGAAEEGIHHAAPSGIVVLQQFIFLVGSLIRNNDLGIEDVLVALELGIATNKQEVLTRV